MPHFFFKRPHTPNALYLILLQKAISLNYRKTLVHDSLIIKRFPLGSRVKNG
jgi:hypothetical protein